MKEKYIMPHYINELIAREKKRQEETINLIASENYASPAVMDACGSVLTNKYAEGYPGKRYYGGCEIIDQIEDYAITSGKNLFHAAHINVQPHSGSSANMAAYLSFLKPGDTILGMSLASGGHLTHGHPLNFSGILYNIIPYNVSPETELLDYDEIALLAHQHKPKLIVAGASAYSRIIDFARIATIAQEVQAVFMVDMAHIAGLVAAGLHPSPVPVADIVTSTTHKTLRGPRGGLILSTAERARAIDRALFPGTQGGPLMNIIAAKAIAFQEASTPAFKTYQQQVIDNAKVMTHAFIDRHYKIVSGGTDNHLFMLNIKARFDNGSTAKVTGKMAEDILSKCNIVVNRNSIPYDTESPMTTSGIRIGTPAITTRGFGTDEVHQIVAWIDDALHHRDDDVYLAKIGNAVRDLCKKFPIYL